MNTKNYNFQKLTPKDDIIIDTYESAIDFVFSQPDIKIVGITGAYCSGKSSVLETYKKGNSNRKFLHISLANFSSTSKNLTNENIFEGKILNQLIHQIESDQIPQTNFRIKTEISDDTIHLNVSLLLLLILTVFFTFGFSQWSSFVNSMSASRLKDILLFSTNPEALFISVPITFAILGYFFYSAFELQLNKNILKKINVQGNEIEIFEKCEDSYFDKYLNEVLYLFNNTDANAIVFEDMDRYNSIQIFQRLREINTLINHRRDNKLRFFFLLRDDIFESKDRTKFFDFIIPIVPVIDSSNSYDQFITLFKNGNLLSLFKDKYFLQGISLYIDDMRILKNIYNEFVIYNNRIGKIELDSNKLLGIIAYKNIFPKDFNNLQLGRGYVHFLIENKNSLINSEIEKLENEIITNKQEIQDSINEIAVKKEELDYLYERHKINRRLPENLHQEYNNRVKSLENRINGNIQILQAKIDSLELKKEPLRSKKLSEVILKARDNIDEYFESNPKTQNGENEDFENIRNDFYFPLLKYLLRYGLIDESFRDYMTYFYEESLSLNDKLFVRSVIDQKKKECSYILQQPAKIIDLLRDIDFENEETLNFDLLDFLLNMPLEYETQLKHMFIQLIKQENFSFISKYFDARKNIKNFVCYANNHCPNLFTNIINSNNLSKQLKKRYTLESIYNSTDEDILVLNSKNFLFDFIVNQSDFLDIENPKVSRIIHVFELLKIQFPYINYNISNLELWKEVYSHNLYELNWEMVNSILFNQYQLTENIDFQHMQLSLALSNESEPLAKYIDQNLNEYIEIIFVNCDSKITDNENTIVHILNHNNIDIEKKGIYLEYLITKIHILENIKDSSFWIELIDENHIEYNEKNILTYFFGNNNTFDSTLIHFINSCDDEIRFNSQQIDDYYGEKSASTFFTSILKCNELKNEKYSMLLRSFTFHYPDFSIDGIDEDKINILLDQNKIRMSLKTLSFMRENYPNNIMNLIKRNIHQYVEEIIDESNFSMDETLSLIPLGIKLKYKTKLLRNTIEPISIMDTKFPANVQTYILKNNFDQNDLQYLLSNHDELSPGSQNALYEITLSKIDKIVNTGYSIAFSLLNRLLANKGISHLQKVILFSFSIEGLKYEECKICLDTLGLDDFLGLFERKRPKFENNVINKRILEAFKKNKWITSFYPINSQYIQANGRDMNKKSIFSKIFD